jgi:hypothetical protein
MSLPTPPSIKEEKKPIVWGLAVMRDVDTEIYFLSCIPLCFGAVMQSKEDSSRDMLDGFLYYVVGQNPMHPNVCHNVCKSRCVLLLGKFHFPT